MLSKGVGNIVHGGTAPFIAKQYLQPLGCCHRTGLAVGTSCSGSPDGTSEDCQHLASRRRACQTNAAAAGDWTRSRREGALKPQTLMGSLSGAARNGLTVYAGNSPVRWIRSARGKSARAESWEVIYLKVQCE